MLLRCGYLAESEPVEQGGGGDVSDWPDTLCVTLPYNAYGGIGGVSNAIQNMECLDLRLIPCLGRGGWGA